MRCIPLLLIAVYLFAGCERKEEIDILNRNRLVLRWNSTIRDNPFKVFLYETEYDYLNHIIKPGYETTSSNVNSAQRIIDYNTEASFTTIKPINYYISVINVSPDSYNVEHNHNYSFQLKDNLVDFAKTTLRINVTNHRINAGKIDKLKYFNFPANLDLSLGKPFTFTLYKVNNNTKDTSIIETQNLIVEENRLLEIQPQHTELLNFSSTYENYLIGISSDSGKEHFTPLTLLNLIKQRMYFDKDLSLYDPLHKPKLSIEVNWN